MNESPRSPLKKTPTRRHGRHGGKSSSQKAYASENDATKAPASRQRQTPRTPVKNTPTSPAFTPANGEASRTGSHQRSGHPKAKSRDVVTSPEDNKSRNSTSAAHAELGTAFAGATFHASPAASALPLPRFLSASSNESPLARKFFCQEPSPPATDPEVGSPYRTSSASGNTGSPLDFMFRAHREEKLRETLSAQRSSLASPPAQFDCTSPSIASHMRRSLARESFHESFEMDVSADESMDLAFSKPYHDRIRAARTSVPNPAQDSARQSSDPMPESASEALKRFLSNENFPLRTVSTSPSAPTQSVGRNATLPQSAQMDGIVYGRPENFEDHLRRILSQKLASDAPAAQRQFSNH